MVRKAFNSTSSFAMFNRKDYEDLINPHISSSSKKLLEQTIRRYSEYSGGYRSALKFFGELFREEPTRIIRLT